MCMEGGGAQYETDDILCRLSEILQADPTKRGFGQSQRITAGSGRFFEKLKVDSRGLGAP